MTKNRKTFGQDKQKQNNQNLSGIYNPLCKKFQILPLHLVWNLERAKYHISISLIYLLSPADHTVQSTWYYDSFDTSYKSQNYHHLKSLKYRLKQHKQRQQK